MILYNVTVNIHESVQDQWLKWMQQTRIPAILATGKFSSAKIVKVLIEEEMGGTTYSIQFTTDCKATLEQYYAEDAPRFRQESYQLFGEKMLTFRTELEVISEHN
jgi:phosphoribosylamine-glycine ligase